MNIFKKKQNPKKELPTVEFSKDILLDVDLSTPTIPGNLISSYYGQPIHFSLSSGTYDELYEWSLPSGTVYGFDQNYDIALRDKTVRLDVLICQYCESKILINSAFTKETITSLSCPNCGARL